MTAPGIPNLKELLGSGSSRGRGLRARGRGRGRGSERGTGTSQQFSAETSSSDAVSEDVIIQRTDGDAAGSRLSAVNAGYLMDEYATCFYKGSEPPRRFPIINRGTYMRTTAIDKLIARFLRSNPQSPKQIISMGAGTDTRFFRLASESSVAHLVYHELDFPNNTESKIKIIKENPSLLKSITKHLANPDDLVISRNGSALESSVYNIHPIDLRTISTAVVSTMPFISSTAATLLLSECCLIYLSPQENDRILDAIWQSLAPSVTPVGIIIYEPIRPNDAFGRTMVSNLATRGIHMQTLQRYKDLSSQKTRLKHAAFNTLQCAADINFIFNEWTTAEDKAFVAKREMMDELEEWILLAEHYCLAWGAADGQSTIFADAWSSLPTQE